MKYDYLIVGAGYAGSILAERITSQLNKTVLLIDKRKHIGGNSYDYYDENGIFVHKYGPHAFHTSSKKVWDFLSQYTNWHPYEHKVLAVVDGKKIPIPFNLNSIEQIFPNKQAENLKSLLLDKYGFGVKIPILKLREQENKDLKFLADFVYNNIFLGYTVKQWGMKPEEIDFSVTSRVPVFISRDDRYFQDTYQGIPVNGYTAMFEKIIANPFIHLQLNTDYKSIINDIKFDKLIYTGQIDSFFDYIHGRLPYRSLTFDFKTINKEYFQETAQVNYPNDHEFTRITEFKHFLCKNSKSTTIAYEFPKKYEEGLNEPYYPIPHPENDELFAKYKKEAEKLEGKVYFIGRLAEYKYYNMDQIAEAALNLFEKKIAV